jgi:acyl-homoserine-lactone acylase
VVRQVDGNWVSVALMEEPMNALIQSYSRTKARNLEAYLEIMEAHTNSSNNTLFADAEGNVAYLHSNFVPVRDPRFDYDNPVPGWDPATDWQGVHTLAESPNAINPATGWAMCTNNWPWSAAGSASPRQADFPAYMDRGTENPRGENALLLLEGSDGWTLEGLREAAYTTHLPAFARMVPPLVEGWDALAEDHPLKAATAPAVEVLREWDFQWDVNSVPTTLAIFWGTELLSGLGARASQAGLEITHYAAWGEVNRFQRLSGDIRLSFDDDAPSLPVGFTSARWGSLASYGAAPRGGTNRWYGTSGNSFVAVVEFGERVRAVAITAGGLSSDPDSPHFLDQAERYAEGNLRPVHFHPDEVEAATVRSYRPGER